MTVGIDIQSPRPKDQKCLLDKIGEPQHNGDFTIKLMLQQPSKFALSKSLVVKFLKAYYKVLWDRSTRLHSKIQLDVLSGA